MNRNRAVRIGVVLAALSGVAAGGPSQETAAPAATGSIDQALASELVEGVRADVARLRGLPFERPVPVRVIDDVRAREHMLERVRRFGYHELLEVHRIAYELIGLLPPESDPMEMLLHALEEQAGGFYDPEDGVFYLLSDAPAGAASILIAHELTHALEDQHYDLDERLRRALDDSDRLFAASAVHEGSATLVMTAYSTAAVLSGEVGLADLQQMAASEAAKGRVFGELPAVLQRELLGPYVLGASFLARGSLIEAAQKVPLARLNQAYADGPTSSEQILHPERYWDHRDEPRKPSIDAARALPGEGWHRVGGDTFGELTLGLLVGAPTPDLAQVAATLSASWTNEAATGWDGDTWELWKRGEEHALVALSVWDTEADAREFAEALPAGLAHVQMGDRVAFAAGALGRKPAKVLRRLTSPPPASGP